MRTATCFFFCLVIFQAIAYTQPVELPVKVVVSPDHADWEYKTGEPAVFRITVMENSVPVKNARIS